MLWLLTHTFRVNISQAFYCPPSSDSDSENGREMDDDDRRNFADQDLSGTHYAFNVDIDVSTLTNDRDCHARPELGPANGSRST